MIYVLLYALLLVLGVLRNLRGRPRLGLIVSLPLLVLDCLANCLVFFQSWRNTMSGEAWYHQNHPWFGWCYRFINALFFWQANHCKEQALKEAVHGGFWPAWWYGVREG